MPKFDKVMIWLLVVAVIVAMIWGDEKAKEAAGGIIFIALIIGMVWCTAYGASGGAARDERAIKRWIDDE